MELFVKDDYTVAARFTETFLKRNGFRCFSLDSQGKLVRAQKNKWFKASAWVFGYFQDMLHRRELAKARKERAKARKSTRRSQADAQAACMQTRIRKKKSRSKTHRVTSRSKKVWAARL